MLPFNPVPLESVPNPCCHVFLVGREHLLGNEVWRCVASEGLQS